MSDIASVITISDFALKTLSKVSKFRYTFNYARHTIKIAVFGESGAGKSALLSMLVGKDYEPGSTRYNKKLRTVLPNGRRIEFTDCPGQKSYRQERQVIKEDIIKGKYDAIINVVCYGYNESSNSNINMFDNDTNIVKTSYLEANRDNELKQLSEWIDDINRRSGLRWILTVINKADVWADDKNEVLNYYQNGKYAEIFNSVRLVCQHHILPYCSIISPFGGKPMLLRISEKNKKALHDSLLANIQDFINHVRK